MCRKLSLAATVVIMSALPMFAVPALAGTPATSSAPVQPAPATPAAKAAPPAPLRATAEQRLEAERLGPLARAAFWSQEFDADPRDAEAGIKLSKALRDLGRFDDAGAASERVLVVNPSNFDALLESARAHIGAGQGFYAIDPAQRAAALAPRDWRPEALLAVALEQSDRDEEALAAHQKALALAPNNPATLSNLGMYLATHGDSARAEALLRQAVAAPGATAQERQNLALVLGLQGRYDEAEHLARQDLPPAEVSNNLAYLRAAASPPPQRSWDAVKAAQ